MKTNADRVLVAAPTEHQLHLDCEHDSILVLEVQQCTAIARTQHLDESIRSIKDFWLALRHLCNKGNIIHKCVQRAYTQLIQKQQLDS